MGDYETTADGWMFFPGSMRAPWNDHSDILPLQRDIIFYNMRPFDTGLFSVYFYREIHLTFFQNYIS